MKKLIVVLLIMSCTVAYGQSRSVASLRKAQEPDNVFVIYKSTMRLFANVVESMGEESGEDVPDMQEMINGMNEIKVLMYRDQGDMKSQLATLKNGVKSEGYEEVMSIKMNGNTSYVWQKTKNDLPTDFVLVSSNESGVQVLDVDGAPDLANLEKLVSFLNKNGNSQSLMEFFR